MTTRGFPFPKFEPVDLTGVNSHAELQAQIEGPVEDYRAHLTHVHGRQKNWATRMMPFLQNPADATHLRLAERRLASDEHWTRYTTTTDIVDSAAAPLFTYGSGVCINNQVRNEGLRVSAGVPRIYQHQGGAFPRGPYGTTIAPYRDDISLSAMRLGFFDVEYALPSVVRPTKVEREALPMTHFIVFMPSTGFSPKGRLVFSRLTGFEESFDHYALATPDLNAGDYLKYDIIAYGQTLIPEEIPGTEVQIHYTVRTCQTHGRR